MKTVLFLLVACVVVLPANVWAQVGDHVQVANPELTVADTLAELERVHQNHINVLAELYNKVPEHAQPGIRRAIENSQRGLERVKFAKEKARGGRPDGVGQGGGQARGGRPDGVGQGGGQARGGRPDGVGQGGGQARGGRPDGVGQGGGQARGGRPDGVGQGGGQARGGRPDGVGQGGQGRGKSKR